jgi:hypothetical protein
MAIVMLMAKKIFGGALSLARNLVSFGWRPQESYLGGKKKSKKEDKNNVIIK